MKYSRYLIASDLDGTFFGKGASIVPQNLEAIDAFKREGGVFSLSTGRSRMVLDELYPRFPEVANGLSILAGGAYLYDFKKEELRDPIVLDQKKILSLFYQIDRAFPDIGFRISSSDFFICPKKPPFFMNSVAKLMNVCRFAPAEDFRDKPWYKVVYVGEKDEIAALRKFLFEVKADQSFNLTWSSPYGVEILHQNASKGHRIKQLKTCYPDRTIICVGDYANDLDMLGAADIAACPNNALEEVKALAKIHLCDHNDGCIADLIHQL